VRLYDRFVLPRLVDFTCSLKPAMRQRAKIVPAASGKVLEIGFGSGLNLPFYDSTKIQHLWALDPAEEMWDLAREKVQRVPFRVEFIKAPAEDLPLADDTVDTVVVTYALCTVPDVLRALLQIKRVLKPSGLLLFCEHGAAPDVGTRRWQTRLNPMWKRLGGGCNLNRPIPTLLQSSGFRLLEMSTMYIPGWKPASFNYWGTAIPK
jgi:ubiquinone/menaquinone biosynthesis C-methylase UbiE